MAASPQYEVGSIIHLKNEFMGHSRDFYWRIEAICLGGESQESLLHISDATPGLIPHTCYGDEVPGGHLRFVPEIMVRTLITSGAASVYEAFPEDEWVGSV